MVRIASGDIISDDTEYKIISQETIEADSNGNPRQRVFTAVGKPGTTAVEMLQIGETFFNYCMSTFAMMSTAHGTVKQSISADQNYMKMLEERKKKKK